MVDVDLAAQAFDTSNYDLAAQLYERLIADKGPNVGLYISLGNSFAKAGDIRRAFDAYTSGFRLGNVTEDQLNHLVSALVDEITRQELIPQSKETVDMFSCYNCKALLQDPVTIPCGHTFCRKCLTKDKSRTCKKCSLIHHYMNLATVRANVVLSSSIERWFPHELKSMDLKSKGNVLFGQGNYQEALSVYTDAISHAPYDHLLISNRAFTHISLNHYKEALQDSERVIQLKPHWPKGYFRKAEAYCGLGRYEEAVIAYLQCLALDPTVVSARSALAKVLHKLLSPIPVEDLKRTELQSVVLSGLHSPTFAGPLLQPEMLVQLKATFRDTIAKRKLQNLMAKCVMDDQQDSQESSSSMKYTLDKPSTEANEQHGASAGPHIQTLSCDHPIMHLSSNLKVGFRGNLEGHYRSCSSAPSSAKTSPLSSPTLSKKNGNKRHSTSSLVFGTTSSQNPNKRLHMESQILTDTNSYREPSELTSGLVAIERPPRTVARSLLNIDDFECSLCYRLLYQPVTTPCGHTYCRCCLDRSMDHSSFCPLCKGSLVEYLAERRQATTEAIENIIKEYFYHEFEARKLIHEEEVSNLATLASENQREIPIFVCTMAFPGMPCPLHVFEPRYRLMIRQCMEAGTRQFGMCIPVGDEEGDFSDYGTILEIQDVQFFPDGRSVVATVGGRRFKVLSRGQQEGYHTAKVELIEDQRVTGSEAEELGQLHSSIYEEAKQWLDNLSNAQKARIQKHFGTFPDQEADIQASPNGPQWIWWLLSMLPLDPRAKLSIMAMTVQKERLQAVQRVISFVKRRGSQ